MDCALPFGLRSAPRIFTAIADVLEWRAKFEGIPTIMHYLEDFLIISPSPSTIKCYLARVRHDQIKTGFGDLKIARMPQLEFVLKGVKRLAKLVVRKRLPITPLILRELKNVWGKEATNVDMKMLWAASCLCFFGFLR